MIWMEKCPRAKIVLGLTIPEVQLISLSEHAWTWPNFTELACPFPGCPSRCWAPDEWQEPVVCSAVQPVLMGAVGDPAGLLTSTVLPSSPASSSSARTSPSLRFIRGSTGGVPTPELAWHRPLPVTIFALAVVTIGLLGSGIVILFLACSRRRPAAPRAHIPLAELVAHGTGAAGIRPASVQPHLWAPARKPERSASMPHITSVVIRARPTVGDWPVP